MNSKRLFQILVGIIVLLIIGTIAGAYMLNNVLKKQSLTLAEQQQQLAVLDGRQDALTRAKQDIAKYQDLANIAKAIVPQDKDQAQTIGEIVKLANANNVRLSSFSFPSSDLGTVVGAKAALSQLEPVKGVPGVYSLLITVQSDNQILVSYNDFIRFLEALEQNRRTAQVTSVNVTPNVDNPSLVSFNLTLQEYIKP